MRKTEFINGGFYHVFNRGVEKRNIFRCEQDYQRFYESMYLFNNKNYKHFHGDLLTRVCLLSGHEIFADERDQFVNIISFCLLPNHFHFLLQQTEDKGISKFMKRVSQGYSRYVNQKYERSGTLYEGSFKDVVIKKDAHLEHMPRYIHLNALDHSGLSWRDGEVENWDKAEIILDNYEWSSHHVYKGKDQRLPIVDLQVRDELFSSVEEYEKFLRTWGGRTCLPFSHLYSDEFSS